MGTKKGHKKGHIDDLFYDPFCGIHRQIVHMIL